MRHDLPDTASALQDRIELLEAAEETASRAVYERHIRPELDAAYAKLHRLKLEQIRAEARADVPPLKQAA